MNGPIVIVGAPRSGTSVLANIFRAHPAVFVAMEPRLVWRWGNDNRSDQLRPEHCSKEVSQYIRDWFSKELTKSNREFLVEKTPSNCLRIDFVASVFPDCKFVHIIRDGVDSALSIRNEWERSSVGLGVGGRARLIKRLREARPSQYPRYCAELGQKLLSSVLKTSSSRRRWGPRLAGIDEMVRDLDLLEVCALQWRSCVETAANQGRLLPEYRYREFRFENLSEKSIEDIFSFVDLDLTVEVKDFIGAKFRPADRSSRRDGLKEVERRILASRLNLTLSWLGYPTI